MCSGSVKEMLFGGYDNTYNVDQNDAQEQNDDDTAQDAQTAPAHSDSVPFSVEEEEEEDSDDLADLPELTDAPQQNFDYVPNDFNSFRYNNSNLYDKYSDEDDGGNDDYYLDYDDDDDDVPPLHDPTSTPYHIDDTKSGDDDNDSDGDDFSDLPDFVDAPQQRDIRNQGLEDPPELISVGDGEVIYYYLLLLFIKKKSYR